jgi:hypothetical protein
VALVAIRAEPKFAAPAIDAELHDQVAEFYADPLGFVVFAYPWGEPGELANYEGPDDWQREFLTSIGKMVEERGFDGLNAVAPIKDATASGHGIGKSTVVAWLVNWIMSTRPNCKGTVTANTITQLDTKTWPAIQKWTKLCITRDWFRVTGEAMKRVGFEENWYCTRQTCKAENSEAFQGQHAADSTSFYIIDEASAVPDEIWEAADWGLTDGEPMLFAFGNPTRRSGKFYRVCFGSELNRWTHRSIDSRSCRFPNKTLIDEALQDYGEDSDVFRVRVQGLPPNADELQFIDSKRVEAARKRIVTPLEDEPLIAGFDVSGGGAAWNVIRFRRGQDGRSVPPVRISGERGRDRNVLIGVLSEILNDRRPDRTVAAIFVDSAFGSPIVERLRVLGHKNVHEVNFGGESPDPHQLNWRAYMRNKLKEWLLTGAIPDDEALAGQLVAPGYHINRQNKLVLESKAEMAKRGEPSPDDADAYALTFAQAVAPPKRDKPRQPRPKLSAWS